MTFQFACLKIRSGLDYHGIWQDGMDSQDQVLLACVCRLNMCLLIAMIRIGFN